MPRKLAIKHLTGSDLTIFNFQYRNLNYGNQKALNLNKDIFIDRCYPNLASVGEEKTFRFPVDVYMYGPGLAGEYSIKKKIIKGGTYKNWRMNGELVYNPPDNPQRFDQLGPDDFVVLEFMGDIEPAAVKAIFVAISVPEDESLYNEINSFLGGKRMISVTVTDLELIINRAQPVPEHPIYNLINL